MPRPESRVYDLDDASTVAVARLIGAAILIFVVVIMGAQGSYVVKPGMRGVLVTLGKVSPDFKPEGFGFKSPFISKVVPVSVRLQAHELKAECYSSDLQQVNTRLRILYSIPEESVVKMFQEYAGDPFDSLIAPRVQEALKEVTALQTAENIVTNRLAIKTAALDLAKRKIGTNFLNVVDLVLEDISLSRELQVAIEQKMIREQEANKARFVQKQAEIDAETAIIKARGEGESIEIRGKALRAHPAFIDLQIIEKWDGKSPLVIGGTGASGDNILLPLGDLQRTKR
ncbi:MAG: prohibitin family protein [Verrucomicrobiota bacterium]